ncbi:hypothetical protein L211DRAFT_619511 [Terfezia boudieri ATCC MYA-4762]|uniref:Uncharacterized protein n=1 Tax=Terfezia boudieri ATCC MYA-4762 TaxID=1051890 RepID=A0A3N4M0B6_9PEZI|nr:hypothetical protein L211DRAFT_619511 [Terfezia boudieri ATCC MYA-4762]
MNVQEFKIADMLMLGVHKIGQRVLAESSSNDDNDHRTPLYRAKSHIRGRRILFKRFVLEITSLL